MARPKRNPSNTVQNLVDAAQNASLPELVPPPHIQLRDEDRPFWRDIIRGRARNEWTESDLSNAAQLARCQADMERLSRELAGEADIIDNTRGTPIPNPKHLLLEVLTRRSLAVQRLLGMQALASGRTENKKPARDAERAARAAKESLGVDDLIPMQ